MHKTLKTFIKEIISIVFGILIALYINNWNEDRKDQNYIDTISKAIQKELVETDDDITKKLEQQHSLMDTIRFYAGNDQITIDQILKKADGIYVPSIRLNAWKAIANSKIELLDYDRISTLADIETQKELIDLKAQKLIDFVYENYGETTEDKKIFMSIILNEVINTEISLQQDVQKMIEYQD